jgi:pimeloyl-ACP methyl ester carboxylesterase
VSLERCQQLVADAATHLRDPQGRELAAAVQWWQLPGWPEAWPVAVLGEGEPVLLLHGFDSSFLEFRRLAPLLLSGVRLHIPDLFGFGFCPRPAQLSYGPQAVLAHLEAVVHAITAQDQQPLGLIGASMGGAVAVELARRLGNQISRLLLLAPAGLTGRPLPLPPLLDGLGVRFLALPGVRRGLCRSAFSDPARQNWRSLRCTCRVLAGPKPCAALPAPEASPAAVSPCHPNRCRCSGAPMTASCGHR